MFSSFSATVLQPRDVPIGVEDRLRIPRQNTPPVSRSLPDLGEPEREHERAGVGERLAVDLPLVDRRPVADRAVLHAVVAEPARGLLARHAPRDQVEQRKGVVQPGRDVEPARGDAGLVEHAAQVAREARAERDHLVVRGQERRRRTVAGEHPLADQLSEIVFE